jgi:hypothetical protein
VSQWETDTQKLTLQKNLQSCWKVRSEKSGVRRGESFIIMVKIGPNSN